MELNKTSVQIELTLLTEVYVSQPQVVSVGELSALLSSTNHLSCDSMDLVRMPFRHHDPSISEAGRRVGPKVIRVGELSLSASPPPAATLGRTHPLPHLSSTIEPTQLVEAWVNQPQSCVLGKVLPTIYLSCAGVGGGEMPPLPLIP